jgi:D-aspartate ligase
VDEVSIELRTNGEEADGLTALTERADHFGKWGVGEAVAVGREERILASVYCERSAMESKLQSQAAGGEETPATRDRTGSTPVVVLGSGITALGVVRSLGRARLKPYLVWKPGDFAGRSRWLRGRVLQIDESSDSDALLVGLDRCGIGNAVLIAATDVWSAAVSRLPDSTRERFPTSMPSAEVLDLFVDKWLFAQALDRHGVPHPRTISVESEDDLFDTSIENPFLKPRNSQLFARHYHRKAFTFSNPGEAREAYRKIVDVGLTAVLQDYIPGSSTEHVFVDGFVDRTGVVRATFARRRLRMYPPDFGNSTLTVSIAPEEAASAIAGVTRLLERIGYRGIFSAEFKLDPRDDEFKILEVNSRPWWYIGFAAHCGVDVAVMAYRDALGYPVPQSQGYAVGERCVLLPQEIRAYLHIRRQEHLAFGAWVRSWAGATPTVLAWDDPLPALSAPSFLARRRVARVGRG